MSGDGGKGGTQNSSQQIDPRLAAGAAKVVSSGFDVAAMPYRPNQGTTIAAMSPQQMAAFQGANEAAGAFGLPQSTGALQYLPDAEVGAGGVRGYSTGDIYRESVNRSMSETDMQRQAELLQSFKDKAQEIEDTPAPQPAGGGGK